MGTSFYCSRILTLSAPSILLYYSFERKPSIGQHWLWQLYVFNPNLLTLSVDTLVPLQTIHTVEHLFSLISHFY